MIPDLPPRQELRRELDRCGVERRAEIAAARERVTRATDRTRRFHVPESCTDDSCLQCAEHRGATEAPGSSPAKE